MGDFGSTRIIAIETLGGIQPGQLLIEGATASIWSHTRGVTDTGSILDATWELGVHEREKPKGGYLWCRRTPLDFLTVRQQRELFDRSKADEGQEYDVPWIVGWMFKRDWEHSDKKVCCELYAKHLKEMGIFPKLNQNRVLPGELMRKLDAYRAAYFYV